MEIIKPGYTRVSEILSQWDRFSGIDRDVLENKKRIGTNVHEAIDLYNACLPYSLEEDERGYFESYIEWRKLTQFEILASETRLYDDRLMITGAFDLLVKFPQEEEGSVCDLKCSYSEDPINWPMQGCFYRYLLTVNGGQDISQRVNFIKLDKRGYSPDVYEYDVTNMMRVCESAVITYNHQKPWLIKRKQGERE